MTQPIDDGELKQANTWQLLYDQIRQLMLTIGTEDSLRTADCWVHDENWGHNRKRFLSEISGC